MSLMKILAEVTQYFAEAIVYIFSPIHDDLPAIGVQPFRGDFPGPSTEDWTLVLSCPLPLSGRLS